MKRTFIDCPLCPSRFLTPTDFDHHMKGFTADPSDHIRRFVSNMSYPKKLKRRRGRELFREYLTDRGVKPRPAPKRPKGDVLSLDMLREKYSSKIEGFRCNYCSSGNPVKRPIRKTEEP